MVAYVMPQSSLIARALVTVVVLLLCACGGRSGTGANDRIARPEDAVIDLPAPVLAQTLDMLLFGDTTTESAHMLNARFSTPQATVAPLPSEPSNGAASDTLVGQFGLTARRLLPRAPNGDYYGGEISFTMTVDPVKLNYFTVKTWGADSSNSWMVLNVEGLEVGWRHDYGATDEMMFHQANGWYAGAFTYRTMRLPFHLTRGKTSVNITLRSLGEIHYYAGGDYNNKQTRMSVPTVPLYAAYTHVGAQLDVSSERQGTVAPGKQRPAENGATFVANWKTKLNNRITNRLSVAVGSLTPDDLQLLGQSYGVSWSAGYRNAATVTQVRDGLDAMVRAYAAAPTSYLGSFGNDSWGGYLGGAGEGARLLKTQLAADLETNVDYGGSIGLTTRRNAWGIALRASVDTGRMNRLTITNQTLWAAWRIYLANRALLELQPSMALKEAEARRYLYEAAGIAPWLGNDQPGGGDTPVRGNAPYGPNWFMVTSDGTSKEDCMVGGDYGEVGAIVMRWAVNTEDNQLRAQAVKMLRARSALRYPGTDTSGWRAFVAAEPVGCRNSHGIGWHVGYVGNSDVDGLLVASLGVDTVGADLIGYAQQAEAEGNLFSRIELQTNIAGWTDSIRVPEYFERFKAHTATGAKLPMSDGAPNFAWADRDNMVVAAKHGDQRFWAALNWRGAVAMNRLARVFVTTPENAFIGEVGIDDVQYTPAGRTLVASAKVEGYDGDTPPDKPTNANSGQSYPAALRPDLTREPSNNRDAGRADAYTLRYGHWLIGLNAHPTRSYEMKLPAGFTSAVDLASATTRSGPVTVAPRSYVVFYLPSAIDGAVSPANPLQAVALAGVASVSLGWEHTPGASSYVVSRADVAAGPFVKVSGRITGAGWVHSGSTGGYYRVQAVDALGNMSGQSPTVVADLSPSASALDALWASADVGSVAASGSASRSASSITLRSFGRDLWGSSDGFHYVFRPLVGNGAITVRVSTQEVTHPWARTGVMIRESLAPDARQAAMLVTGANGAEFNWRAAPGASSQRAGQAGYVAPVWLRLSRSGAVLIGEVSNDGGIWTRVSSVSIGMGPLVYVGLVATSASGKASMVEFDNIDVPTLVTSTTGAERSLKKHPPSS